MITLSEKQKDLVTDMQTQEELCIQKYTFYMNSAKDPELKKLFGTIKKEEEQHYQSLGQLLQGICPSVNSKDSEAKNYQPSPTYGTLSESEDKAHDQYLCTDSITTEKYVSGVYNNDLFAFGENNIRTLLNDIQTEEQNHAEMIYKYKTANHMK